MGRVSVVTNQKGGVGKTTTTVNLAASLAIAERKTLVIDFDPQGNGSSALGVSAEDLGSGPNIYHSLIGDAPMAEAIRSTDIDFLSLCGATSDLTGAEVELVSAFARESKLKAALAPIRDQFDYILIDCPPSLGLLTVNTLTAADSFLVPLQCEYFALEGLSQLLHTVSLIQQSLNTRLEMEGVVLTMYDKRNRLSGAVESEVRGHLGDKVFDTVIPRNVRLSECSSHGKPIILYDVDSKGCLAYLNLAKEILERNQSLEAQEATSGASLKTRSWSDASEDSLEAAVES